MSFDLFFNLGFEDSTGDTALDNEMTIVQMNEFIVLVLNTAAALKKWKTWTIWTVRSIVIQYFLWVYC